MNAEFGGFLDQNIHAWIAAYALQQSDRQWRLRLARHAIINGDGDFAAPVSGDASPVVKAVTVKQV